MRFRFSVLFSLVSVFYTTRFHVCTTIQTFLISELAHRMPADQCNVGLGNCSHLRSYKFTRRRVVQNGSQITQPTASSHSKCPARRFRVMCSKSLIVGLLLLAMSHRMFFTAFRKLAAYTRPHYGSCLFVCQSVCSYTGTIQLVQLVYAHSLGGGTIINVIIISVVVYYVNGGKLLYFADDFGALYVIMPRWMTICGSTICCGYGYTSHSLQFGLVNRRCEQATQL